VRLATYAESHEPGAASHVGVVLGERIVRVPGVADMLDFIARGDAARALAARLDASAGVALAAVRLLAPIPAPRRNVMCVGLNYADHVAESQSVAGAEAPKFPTFFSKPPSTVIGPGDTIPWHGHVTQAVDWEVELAVVIGRPGRDIAAADALSHVFGYTVANDVTARDLQQRHGQWFKGKGLDGFCPLGPVIVTADEIGDPGALDLWLRVNGVEKQRSSTRHLIFDVPRLIADLSAGMTLLPGDLLLTGTPSGTGIGRTPPEFLRPGDVVEAEIPRIGVLRNAVAAS
jgi:2-keto-4-pentenoate hydratase/2-oxohepta-3-ene-1,7-dioic acid hydratase in catechol pathway